MIQRFELRNITSATCLIRVTRVSIYIYIFFSHSFISVFSSRCHLFTVSVGNPIIQGTYILTVIYFQYAIYFCGVYNANQLLARLSALIKSCSFVRWEKKISLKIFHSFSLKSLKYKYNLRVHESHNLTLS